MWQACPMPSPCRRVGVGFGAYPPRICRVFKARPWVGFVVRLSGINPGRNLICTGCRWRRPCPLNSLDTEGISRHLHILKANTQETPGTPVGSSFSGVCEYAGAGYFHNFILSARKCRKRPRPTVGGPFGGVVKMQEACIYGVVKHHTIDRWRLVLRFFRSE